MTGVSSGAAFAALARRAERLARARLRQRRIRARSKGHRHWRSAPYLWPTFGAGG